VISKTGGASARGSVRPAQQRIPACKGLTNTGFDLAAGAALRIVRVARPTSPTLGCRKVRRPSGAVSSMVCFGGVIRRAPKAILDEKETGMAHREQHGNREAKKVKKEKPKGEVGAQSTRWAVSEIVEARTGSKH
jgi:hypothetical protein